MNRKKIGVLLLLLCVAVLGLQVSPAAEGTGEKDDPLEISAQARIEIIKDHIVNRRDREAEKHFQETLAFHRRHFDKKKIGGLYFSVGFCWFDREDAPLKALECYLQALKIFEEEDIPSRVAFTANMIGALYWHTNQYEKAMKYYLKALKMYREIGGHDVEVANILNNIGMVYTRLGNYDIALEHYWESLEMRERIGHPQPVAASLNNIGQLYSQMKDYSQALHYFNLSQEIRKKINDRRGVVKNLINIGDIYLKTGRPDQGVASLREALEISEAINYRRGSCNASVTLGQYYQKINDTGAALPFLENGIALARGLKSKEMLNDACRSLASLYAAKGDYREAYRYSAQLKENILTIEARQKLEDMRLAQAMEEKEQAVFRLKKENRIHRLEKRMQIITFSAIFLLLATGFTYVYKYNRLYKNELIRKEEKQRRLELETKLKLFQARINPHFLFNSLNSIKELGKEKNTAALEQTVHHLAHMYRQILYSNNTMQVPLEKEIALITDYLEIEKKMLKGNLDYAIHVDDGLADFPVLPLTIETLVENAVIHGVAPRQKGTVTITALKKEKSVFIEIADDGAGFDPLDMEPGFGIYSVQERLKLFYNNKAGFHIHSSPGNGARVQMELPNA